MLSSLWKCEKEKEENTQLSGPLRQEGWLLNNIDAKEDR